MVMRTNLKTVILAALAYHAVGPGVRAEDETAGPAIRQATLESLRSEDAGLRTAAIRVLGQIGTASDVPTLVRAAAGGKTSAERDAAFQGLARLRAQGADAAILALWDQASAGDRQLLVQLFAARQTKAAVPLLLHAAQGTNPTELRLESLKALGNLGDEQSVGALIALLPKVPAGAEREAADRAVCAVCRRIADAERQADPLLTAIAGADPETRSAMLPVLGRLGGAKALEAIRQAAGDADPRVQDAAVRALCNWPDAGIAPELLKIAEQGAKESHRIWALRGLARVAPLGRDRTPQQTLDLLQQAMACARRPEDKQLILQRAAAVRTPEALRLILSYTRDEAAKSGAVSAALQLSKDLLATHPRDARAALETLRNTTKDQAVLTRIQVILEGPDAQGR